MSRFIAKKVLFNILFLSILIILSMTIRVYAASTPPAPTGITVPPLPTYCEITNGGVEICDGLDNNCNSQIDEGFNVGASCGSCGGVNVCSGGIAVCSKTTPAGFGNACTSAANSCGQTNSGTIG